MFGQLCMPCPSALGASHACTAPPLHAWVLVLQTLCVCKVNHLAGNVGGACSTRQHWIHPSTYSCGISCSSRDQCS